MKQSEIKQNELQPVRNDNWEKLQQVDNNPKQPLLNQQDDLDKLQQDYNKHYNIRYISLMLSIIFTLLCIALLFVEIYASSIRDGFYNQLAEIRAEALQIGFSAPTEETAKVLYEQQRTKLIEKTNLLVKDVNNEYDTNLHNLNSDTSVYYVDKYLDDIMRSVCYPKSNNIFIIIIGSLVGSSLSVLFAIIQGQKMQNIEEKIEKIQQQQANQNNNNQEQSRLTQNKLLHEQLQQSKLLDNNNKDNNNNQELKRNKFCKTQNIQEISDNSL